LIRRVARLIGALGGAAESDGEIAAVAEALRKSGVDLLGVADGLIEVMEELARDREGRGGGWWAASTAIGACFAAIGGALGLRAIAVALVPGSSWAWIVPLIAVPVAVFAMLQALIEARARRADQRERAAVSIGLALAKLGIAARVALQAGVVVSGLEAERARHLIGLESERAIAPLLAVRKSGLIASAPRARGRFFPGLAAVWAIACFWILYFGTVATSMSKGFGE
jgi:hypothetical protein